MAAIFIAAAIPLIVLYIIWALEIYAFSRMRLVLYSLAWGAIAFCIALSVQNILIRGLLNFEQIAQFVAPVLEEILKAAFLIWLLRRLALRYAVDGATYGFAIGTGFALFENLFHIGTNTEMSLPLALARTLSVSLMHASNSAVVGAFIGSIAFQSAHARLNRTFGAVTVAILIHAIFNQLVISIDGAWLMLVALGIGFGGTLTIVLVIEQALRNERKAIHRELADQLSAGELAASMQPAQVMQLLATNRAAIGPDRAAIVQKYVTLQAQRGILAKALSLNQRPKSADILRRSLESTEEQLAALRHSMGLYMWIWLRRVLPSGESTLWAQLDHELHTDQPLLAMLVELSHRQQHMSADTLACRKALLRRSSLFRELADEELEDLALLLRQHRFGPDETVIAQGTVDDHLYCVLSGTLVASATDVHGIETIVGTFAAGETFGELSLIDGEPHPTTISGLSDGELYSLARADLMMLMFAKPQVSLEMMRQLVGTIRQNTALLMWMQQTASGTPQPA